MLVGGSYSGMRHTLRWVTILGGSHSEVSYAGRWVTL